MVANDGAEVQGQKILVDFAPADARNELGGAAATGGPGAFNRPGFKQRPPAEPCKRLFVGNLPYSIKDVSLHSYPRSKVLPSTILTP